MNVLLMALSSLVAVSVLDKRQRDDTGRKEWALLSRSVDKRTGKRRVLYWFGPKKPTKEEVAEQERRIQYFKHAG